jgi:adenosylcobinamide kinase / adenosylcobinamide-phosphate guanylyltransferase
LIELILGGARSGKSRLAESRALSLFHSDNRKLIYIATATAHDEEMSERIMQHQKTRSEHWQVIEEPVQLADVMASWNDTDNLLLVECLTLWLSNLICEKDSSLLAFEKKKFLKQIQGMNCDVILVSNETGLGVVPMGELSRRYVDEAGWLHQELAQISDRVTLVVAGLEQTLKAPESISKTFKAE